MASGESMKTKRQRDTVPANSSGARPEAGRMEPRKGRDAMKGFRPGAGNTGSMDGSDEVGRKQVGHKI
jgi:hypothetical protein